MKIKRHLLLLAIIVLWSLGYSETKTVILQQGLDEYNGCEDQELRDPDRNYGRGPKEGILLLNGY